MYAVYLNVIDGVVDLTLCFTARFPLSLHFQMVENKTSLSTGQQGMGISKVWTLVIYLKRFSSVFLIFSSYRQPVVIKQKLFSFHFIYFLNIY